MSKKPIQKEFQRKEIKYLIDIATFDKLLDELNGYLVPDEYANSNIANIYFDSPNYQIIRDSLNLLNGGEKIRMRTYDPQPSDTSQAFLEIKKKEKQGDTEIGRKYRLTSVPPAILDYVTKGLTHETIGKDDRVNYELAKLRKRYTRLVPKMYISYKRFSMKGVEDPKLRITFDRNIRYSQTDLNLASGPHGLPLLEGGKMIMEVKVREELPTWLSEIFDRYQLVSQSFSKYTTAYLKAHNLTPDQFRKEISSIA